MTAIETRPIIVMPENIFDGDISGDQLHIDNIPSDVRYRK
jgi:hypothetical protein